MKNNIMVGINFLPNVNLNTYKILFKNNLLSILKYPGKKCNKEELDLFIKCCKYINISADIHGLPGVLPATHDKMFLENVNWEDIPKELFELKESQYYSTHIGLKNKDRISNYNEKELENTFINNINKIKSKVKQKYDKDIFFGAEMHPGGFDFDINTLQPEYIGKVWKKIDFGVFDIVHVELALKELNITFDEYIKKLTNKEKVLIMHISGNSSLKDKTKTDKHSIITTQDLYKLINIIEKFPNLQKIIIEHAVDSKYSTDKEVCIQVISLNIALKTKNKDEIKDVYQYIEKNLKNDCSNLENIISNIKSKL